MRLHRALPALLAGLSILVFASPASAVTFKLPPFLFAKAGKVKGYTVTFTGGNQSASLDFLKKKRGSTQTHALTATGFKTVKYTAATNLSKATLRANLGSRGKINLTFRATGRAHRTLPRGCTGKANTVRTGVLSGSLRVKLDKHFFKTIVRKRLSGFIAKAGSFFCGGSGGFGGRSSLSLNVPDIRSGVLNGNFSHFVGGKLDEGVSVHEERGTIDYSHSISATAPTSYIHASRGLATLSVRGFGPFLAGTVKFRATAPAVGTGRAGVISGGTFVAKFDSIGRRRFKKGAAAGASS